MIFPGKLVSVDCEGDIHAAVYSINKYRIGDYVLSIHPVTPEKTIIVFKFASYTDYNMFCVRQNIPPMSYEEFYK